VQKIREIKLPKATDLALSLKNETEDAQKTKEFCDQFSIKSNDDLQMAVKALAEIKTQYKEYEAKRKKHIKSLFDAIDDINSFFAPALDALDLAEKIFKNKVDEWVIQCLDARDTALAAVEDAPEEKRITLIKEANNLVPPKIPGLSFKEPWSVSIEKPIEAFKWILKNERFELLTVDKKAITALVKAKDEDPNIPGVLAKRNRSVIITPGRVL
jgi:hypothetical protein